MAQDSLYWNTSVSGDGLAPYTQAQMFDFHLRMFNGTPTTECVVPRYGNQLAPTVGTNAINIASGAAIVYGAPYSNTASEAISIATPNIGTTGHAIVLRADWSTRTVRLARLSSSDGVAAIPAVTQIVGTTWKVLIASCTITVTG